MKKIKIILIALALSIFIYCKKREIQIIPIESLNYTRTVNNGERDFTNRGIYFLVRGYEDSPEILRYIENFISANKDKDYVMYDNYGIILYRESSHTTIESIKNNPKTWDHYSNENDRIYKYVWSKGVFIARYKYKKGEIIEPKSDVELGPAPPLIDSIK